MVQHKGHARRKHGRRFGTRPSQVPTSLRLRRPIPGRDTARANSSARSLRFSRSNSCLVKSCISRSAGSGAYGWAIGDWGGPFVCVLCQPCLCLDRVSITYLIAEGSSNGQTVFGLQWTSSSSASATRSVHRPKSPSSRATLGTRLCCGCFGLGLVGNFFFLVGDFFLVRDFFLVGTTLALLKVSSSLSFPYDILVPGCFS
jgi:hypothetical protein